jgi:ABC-type multidrug transport system fused ATPase/permease subunit
VSLGRTTLTIAHRVSTIRDSNVIFVIENGHVAEKGTFKELIDMKGVFFKLNKDLANH